MKTHSSVKYYTYDKYLLISEENIRIYEQYLNENAIINKDTFDSTYLTYQRNFNLFLIFLAEKYNNIGLYSDEFMQNGPDIVMSYMAFCANTLQNGKKTVNTKVNAITSFYSWANRKGKIQTNPLADKISRIPRAAEEHITTSHFLTDEQIAKISDFLLNNVGDTYDFQDTLLWFIFLDSANRLGAIEQLSLSKLDRERRVFKDVIEKEVRKVDVAFSEETMKLIYWWMEMRHTDYDFLEQDALFIAKNHGKWARMSRSTIQRRIRKIGKIVGIDDLHPHSIRKSAASQMLDHGVDSYLISRYLNHKSMEVLKNYIKPKSSSDLRKQIEEQMNK